MRMKRAAMITLTLTMSSWWTVSEWDVDSFDGREYDSSEEKNEFAKEEHEQKWRRFKRQLIENKGFYECTTTQISNLSLIWIYLRAMGQTYREYFEEMARLCLQKYNE